MKPNFLLVGVLGATAFVALLVAAPIRAQQRAESEGAVLILGTLYRDAEQASPRVDAARAGARAARSRIARAKLPPDPRIQLAFMNYSLPDLEPMDPLGMTQLQLMQMVPAPGKLRLGGRVQGARAAAATARAEEVSWEVRRLVARQFYELYATDRSLEVARETIRLLEDIRLVAEAMYRVGDGRQADVLRAHVEIARMSDDTLRMKAMRDAGAARLNALLDRSQDAPMASPALPRYPAVTPSLDTLVARAQTARGILRAAGEDVRAATAEVRLARRELWPDLEIGIAYGRRGGESVERMGSLMVGTTLPIFARGRQLAMRDEATAMQRMAVAELNEMRAETRGRVAEAHADLTRSRRLTVLYRGTIIPQAEATVQSALSAYRVGRVDFMTVLDARMAVNRFHQELFALQADEGIAWAELEMLTAQHLMDAFTTDDTHE